MNTRHNNILQELVSLDAKVTNNVGRTRVELKVDELGEQVSTMNTNLQSIIDLLETQDKALPGQAKEPKPKDGESAFEWSSRGRKARNSRG